jgi:hypothetical protein
MSVSVLEEKVLIAIAQGSNTFYSLRVKNKVGSNDGIINSLERLTEKGLIVKGPVGPRSVQPYLITKNGFDHVIRYINEINNIDGFVESTKTHFPLVFKYWDKLDEHDLQEWVINTLREQIPRIDARIMSQLITGERTRYSHEEFISDLYDLVYGPWLTEKNWDKFVGDFTLDRIKAFLKENHKILQSRIRSYKQNNTMLKEMMDNNEKYRNNVLESN